MPKAYKLAKPQRIASILQIWMSSIFIQSPQWTCSSHTAFLNRPSKQGSSERIKHEFRDWENHFYTVSVGYCCRGDVISAVQCKQKMKPCILVLYRRKYNKVFYCQSTYTAQVLLSKFLDFISPFVLKSLRSELRVYFLRSIFSYGANFGIVIPTMSKTFFFCEINYN